MKSDKSSKAVNVDGRTSVFARHNADMNIPRLPFKGGKSEGGMLSLQRGNAEAQMKTCEPCGILCESCGLFYRKARNGNRKGREGCYHGRTQRFAPTRHTERCVLA